VILGAVAIYPSINREKLLYFLIIIFSGLFPLIVKHLSLSDFVLASLLGSCTSGLVISNHSLRCPKWRKWIGFSTGVSVFLLSATIIIFWLIASRVAV
jgi:hypothetical protein